MSGENQGPKDGRMTTEEIAAAAAAAKALLDDEKKNSSGDPAGTPPQGKKEGDDGLLDDPTKDRANKANIDMDKTLAYVDKIKDENAKRRIENTKMKERLANLETQLDTAVKALEAATSRIKEVDSKTDEEEAKKRTDLENASKRIDELSNQLSDIQGKLSASEKATAAANSRVELVNRETMIERLVDSQGAKFSSDFERNGLIATLTKRSEDGGFEKNNDEVIYEVMKFIETANKKVEEEETGSINVPKPGQQSRKSATPIGDEIQALLANKGRLSKEQNARLDELLKMSSEARAMLGAPKK